MKKFFKAILAVLTVVVLASCSKVTDSYAEKVRVAEAKGENMTYAEVIDDLGLPQEEWNLLLVKYSKWYKGYETTEEAQAALEEGKTVAYIVITFNSDNLAIDAEYTEETKEVKE
jgi:ABC-type metal ion transport system substrate-binding protein